MFIIRAIEPDSAKPIGAGQEGRVSRRPWMAESDRICPEAPAASGRRWRLKEDKDGVLFLLIILIQIDARPAHGANGTSELAHPARHALFVIKGDLHGGAVDAERVDPADRGAGAAVDAALLVPQYLVDQRLDRDALAAQVSDA